jgi:hypothetical protein
MCHAAAGACVWRSRRDARTLPWVGPPADRDLNSSIDLVRAAATADGGGHGGWPMGWDGSSMIRAAAKRSIILRYRSAVLVEGAVEVLVAGTNASLIQATPRNLRSALTHRGSHFLAAASRLRLTAEGRVHVGSPRPNRHQQNVRARVVNTRSPHRHPGWPERLRHRPSRRALLYGPVSGPPYDGAAGGGERSTSTPALFGSMTTGCVTRRKARRRWTRRRCR